MEDDYMKKLWLTFKCDLLNMLMTIGIIKENHIIFIYVDILLYNVLYSLLL